MKVYFDVDKDDVLEDFDLSVYLPQVKSIISSIFPDADMAISGSVTSSKVSLHIVLQN